MRAGPFAAVAAIAAWAGAAGAQTQDIDFHEIFATLTAKVERTSDLAFFETQVLQGRAVRQADTYPPGQKDVSYHFAYGGDRGGKSGRYDEMAGKIRTRVSFTALDFTEGKGCLTLGEATVALRRAGWSAVTKTKPRPGSVTPPDLGKNVGADFVRRGVELSIDNEGDMTPIFEPWNPPEVAKQQIADMEADRQRRLAIKPGSSEYNALCVDVIEVSFTRPNG